MSNIACQKVTEALNTYVPLVKPAIHGVIEAYLVPLLRKSDQLDRRSKISISAAAALCSFYLLYDWLAKPPRQLRCLPYGNLSVLEKNYRQMTADEYAHEVSLPLALQSPNGMYVCWTEHGWGVHVTRPEAVKQLLFNPDLFLKSSVSHRKGTLAHRLGNNKNVAHLQGAEWKSQRKIINPAFHRSMPVNLFGHLMVKLFGVIDKEIDQGVVDIGDLSTRWALDAIGLAGFGFDFDAIEHRDNEWVVRYSESIKSRFDPFFITFPIFDTTLRFLFPKREKAHREIQIFMEKIDQVIVNKRRTLAQGDQSLKSIEDHEKDLLALMIETGKDGKDAMTNLELRSNIGIFFIAGHESTANAVSAAIYHLAVNQDIQTRARQEVLEVLGDTDQDIMPTVQESRAMPYLNMIIQETLRINPPASLATPRIATQDTELAGVFIPKGTRVHLDIYDLHHNPTVWKDPGTFNPERFADGGEAQQAEVNGWIPFLTGPRQCVGMNLTLAEQRVFLAMFLRKYEWHLPSDSIHKDILITTGKIVLGPNDLKIILKSRY